MVADELDTRLASLLRAARAGAAARFTGLGVVLYEDLIRLPYLSLQAPAWIAAVPTGDAAVTTELSRIATVHSPWHDGFHFVRVSDMRLTHVAQFVSPPLDPAGSFVPSERGARHMAAALASMVEGIVCVGVVPAHGEVAVYRSGRRVCGEGAF
jgi:hypothetical protein